MRTISRRAASMCYLALVVFLVACGNAATAATHTADPTPTVDPVTSAYLAVLLPSYGSYNTAATLELAQCYDHLFGNTKTQILHALAPCRPTETAASDAARAALTQLATASPPPGWQTANTKLKQAIQAMLPYYAARVSAIDAESVEQFEGAFANIGSQALALFCDPITQLNVGPPKLAPPLQVPYGRICNGSESAGVG